MEGQSAARTVYKLQANEEKVKKKMQWNWVIGILFTFLFAAFGIQLAKIPVIDHLGPMVIAILLAIVYRQVFGYPEAIRTGVQFSAKKILRYAIILFGFRLNVEVIAHQGMGILLKDAISIILAITVTMAISKWLKASPSLSLLLAVGTGVCGAAAIAAVSPIIKAKDDDTAIGVGIIALMGTVFTIIYTLLMPLLPLTHTQYGVWSGLSLHEIAHVAAATAPAGEDALAIALLAKLGRVLLLVPLCFILTFWVKKKDANTQTKVDFPWFLVGFIVTSLIGTYAPISKTVLNEIATFSSFLLTAAMVGLGLNVNFQALKSKASKPLLAMFVASIILSLASYVYGLL